LPLARKRLAERGFNQSALLAELAAKELGIGYAPHGLLKVRDTPPQAGLDRAARLKNVRGAFDCGESLAGLRIALVDDVMTTGATLSEAAKVLKKAGASFVSAWVVARADSAGAHVPATDAAVPF
jgi:ComF family protein